MAIRENATVKVIGGFFEGRKGKVVKMHDFAGIALVSFDDNGGLGKVEIAQLVEIQPQESRIVDVKIEIPEGAKKISRADFDAALAEITSPRKMLDGNFNPMVSFTKVLTARIIGDTLREEIFKDQDVVVMTKDEFVVALWDGCNPKCVSDQIRGRQSVARSMDVSVAAILSLREIPDILFGAEVGK